MSYQESQKSVLITGAAGGLGSALVRHVSAQGWHVYAADINETALHNIYADNEAITPITMDVNNTESVRSATKAVAMHTKHLDAIVNFAGILRNGLMVEMDEAAMRLVFDINVMGTFRVNKAFFPMIHKGRGRIINISSETGWQSGQPFNGAYGASKHAIEGYSDSLRRELILLDIPVIKIQPGPFKTNMTASIGKNFDEMAKSSQYFAKAILKAKTIAIKADAKANDPDILAATIYKAMTARKPKAAYSVRPDSGRALLEKLPVRLADFLIKSALK